MVRLYMQALRRVIEANVIILEFLSARLVHPGTLLPFDLFLTRVRTWKLR